MSIDFSFPPDGVRAKQLDQRMRTQLADSLDYLRQSMHEQMGEDIPGLSHVIGQMRQGLAFPPSTFGMYYEISSALIDGDYENARALFAELAAEQPLADQAIRIVTLDGVAKPADMQRYQRLMDTDPMAVFRILPPPPESGAAAMERLRSSLARLRTAVPQLADEFEALIREVILVAGDASAGYEFAGGSCYTLWGALFINADLHTTDIVMLEALAHESAHSLLFGFTIDETLVENPDDERYTSPLRDDPRPMDGIYHATFVSARMHWALSALLSSGTLNDEEIAWASAARDADCRNFFCGYETVSQHARMTDTGRQLMAGAYAYMQPFRNT